MAAARPITQMIILHLKEGVHLEHVVSRSAESGTTQAFLRSAEVTKAQKGFVNQFWGREVEHPSLFVWSVDWESFGHYTTFRDSEAHTSSLSGLDQVFDFSKSPITLYISIVNQESANIAMRSAVTEVAFFKVASKGGDAARKEFNEQAQESLKIVETIGKGTGSTIGWVIDAIPSNLVADEKLDTLYGVFGYASIDVHMKWRETPEAKAAGEGVGQTSWPVVEIPGIDPKTGYFHVHFEEGKW